MITRFTLCFLLPLFATIAANAHTHKATGAKPSKIDSLYYFEPVSGIGLISYRNEIHQNDSLTAANRVLQKKVLVYNTARTKLASQIEVTDSVLRKRVNNELVELMAGTRKKKYLEDLKHPSVIDSIMDAGHKRFALLMLNQGFVRTKENKKFQKHQANMQSFAMMGGLIGGLIYASAVQDAPKLSSSSDLYVMILDAQENETYYFSVNVSQGTLDYNPLDIDEVNTQFWNAFEGFFFPKSNPQRV